MTYALVPENVYADPSLTHGDVRVYLWLRSFDLPGKNGHRKNHVFVSMETIHQRFGMDISQINRHIRRLVAAGHITVQRRNRKAPKIHFTSGNSSAQLTNTMETTASDVLSVTQPPSANARTIEALPVEDGEQVIGTKSPIEKAVDGTKSPKR